LRGYDIVPQHPMPPSFLLNAIFLRRLNDPREPSDDRPETDDYKERIQRNDERR